MQTKLEKFIHDTALRKTMLRAHCQAWAWQDEWYGLTMDDIREIERQTQLALQKQMGIVTSEEDDEEEEASCSNSNNNETDRERGEQPQSQSTVQRRPPPILPEVKEPSVTEEGSSSEEDDDDDVDKELDKSRSEFSNKTTIFGSKTALHSPIGSAQSFDLQVCFDRINYVLLSGIL